MISICTNFHVIDFIFNKVIEIINLGVWEQLSILKIAFGGTLMMVVNLNHITVL